MDTLNIWKDKSEPTSTSDIWYRLNNDGEFVGWFEYKDGKWSIINKKKIQQLTAWMELGDETSSSNGKNSFNPQTVYKDLTAQNFLLAGNTRSIRRGETETSFITVDKIVGMEPKHYSLPQFNVDIDTTGNSSTYAAGRLSANSITRQFTTKNDCWYYMEYVNNSTRTNISTGVVENMSPSFTFANTYFSTVSGTNIKYAFVRANSNITTFKNSGSIASNSNSGTKKYYYHISIDGFVCPLNDLLSPEEIVELENTSNKYTYIHSLGYDITKNGEINNIVLHPIVTIGEHTFETEAFLSGVGSMCDIAYPKYIEKYTHDLLLNGDYSYESDMHMYTYHTVLNDTPISDLYTEKFYSARYGDVVNLNGTIQLGNKKAGFDINGDTLVLYICDDSITDRSELEELAKIQYASMTPTRIDMDNWTDGIVSIEIGTPIEITSEGGGLPSVYITEYTTKNIEDVIIENEKVTAAALNELDDRVRSIEASIAG